MKTTVSAPLFTAPPLSNSEYPVLKTPINVDSTDPTPNYVVLFTDIDRGVTVEVKRGFVAQKKGFHPPKMKGEQKYFEKYDGTVTIKNNDIANGLDDLRDAPTEAFPILATLRDQTNPRHNFVVLLTRQENCYTISEKTIHLGCGVVVHKEPTAIDYWVGCTSDDWDLSIFQPYTGEITLSND